MIPQHDVLTEIGLRMPVVDIMVLNLIQAGEDRGNNIKPGVIEGGQEATQDDEDEDTSHMDRYQVTGY